MNKQGDLIAMAKWGIFPNTTNLGEYDPFSQIVKIHKYESNCLRNLDPKTKPEDFLSVFEIIYHELTHWLDHTSTLWGQNNLLSLYTGIDALIRGEEAEFWKIVQAGKDRKYLNLPKYYSANTYKIFGIYPEREIPWHYDYSCGLEFDVDGKPALHKPIIFMRFKTGEGRQICRVPFTIQSLFEVNATFSEIYFRGNVYAHNQNDENIVNSHLWEKVLLNRLYCPELAIYSTAAHHISNQTGIKDAANTFDLSSLLANLCLNLPNSLFDLIKIPNRLLEVWGDRANFLNERKNPGFAYFVLSYGVKKENGQSGNEWLNEIVKIAGLPPINEIEQMVKHEMDCIKPIIQNEDLLSRLTELLDSGNNNFSQLGILGNRLENIIGDTLTLPPVLFADGKFIPLSKNAISNLYDEKWFNYSSEIENKIFDFLDACAMT